MRVTVVGLTSALVAVVLALPGPAYASSSRMSDPQGDVSGVLDIATAKLQGKGNNKIRGTITTHAAFSDADLAAPNTIGIDFKISDKVVRGVGIRVVDGVLGATICTYKQGGNVLGKKCSDLGAKRLSDTAVQVTIPRKLVARGKKTYRWHAAALAVNGTAGCSETLCLDGVPNRGSTYRTWRF